MSKSTSVGHASAFNKHTVNEYFANLTKAMDDDKFTAEQIFKVDETGINNCSKPKTCSYNKKECEMLTQLHQMKGVS